MNRTVVGPESSTRAVLWVGFPLLGAGAGWVLKALTGWLLDLPWVPFRGPLELLESLPDPQATIGAIVVGALAGLVIGVLAEHELVHVTVSHNELVLGTEVTSPRVSRADTTAVYVDGKELVLLGRGSQELARKKYDLDSRDTQRLERAFRAHGWPWRTGDPHGEEYRRWVEGTPDLPPGVNAILAARGRALERGDKDDAASLREELRKLEVVVRDDQSRQFWRRTTDAR